MSLTKRPKDNQVFYNIVVPFNIDGFCEVEVFPLFSEIGFSKAEFNRLRKSRTIKIKDTRVTEDRKHFEWYWRDIEDTELVEPEDSIKFGKFKYLILMPQKRGVFTRLVWWVQAVIEMWLK